MARIARTGPARPRYIGQALCVGVKAAIRAAQGVEGTPRTIRARMAAGKHERNACSSRSKDDESHGSSPVGLATQVCKHYSQWPNLRIGPLGRPIFDECSGQERSDQDSSGRTIAANDSSAFRRSGNRGSAAERASNARNPERFLCPTNLKPLWACGPRLPTARRPQ